MKDFLPSWLKAKFDPTARYGLRLTLLWIAVALVGIPFAWLVIQVTSEGPLVSFDKDAARAIVRFVHDHRPLPIVFNAISFLGFPLWFWVLIGGVALYLWKNRQRRLVVYLLSSTLGGSLVNGLVKTVVNRTRPVFRSDIAIAFQEGKSFPSGHTMSSTIAYGALLLIFLPLIPRKFRPWAFGAWFLLVTAIGISRLGLGVHYISDVVGGFILGLAWLTASTAAFAIWRREEGGPKTDITQGVAPETKDKLTHS